MTKFYVREQETGKFLLINTRQEAIYDEDSPDGEPVEFVHNKTVDLVSKKKATSFIDVDEAIVVRDSTVDYYQDQGITHGILEVVSFGTK